MHEDCPLHLACGCPSPGPELKGRSPQETLLITTLPPPWPGPSAPVSPHEAWEEEGLLWPPGKVGPSSSWPCPMPLGHVCQEHLVLVLGPTVVSSSSDGTS